ncbi:MAG: Transcriptional activator MetR [Gemmatimonadetes bacterium]|nr:Transcriptional activator MetR [Gemmatimonadota bacterium]
MIVEIKHLRLVRAIADTGSLAAAGGVVNLTSSALSHQLRDLEVRLGGVLFRRLGRRMVPTSAGQKLIEHARRTLPIHEAAEREVRALAAGIQTVRVAAQGTTCYGWMIDVLRRISADRTGLEIEFVDSAVDDPRRALLEGEVDLAFVAGEEPQEGVVHHPLFTDGLVLLVDASHPLADRSEVSGGDVRADQIFLHPAVSEDTYNPSVVRISHPRLARQTMSDASLALVKAGMATALVPRWLGEREAAARGLVAIRWASANPRRTLHWFGAMRQGEESEPGQLELLGLLMAGIRGFAEPGASAEAAA